MKKAISLLLSFIMAFGVTTGIDFSSYALTSGDFNYILLDDGTAKITGYNGSAEDIIIPATLNGYMVTSIRCTTFSKCESLTIPDSVINIDAVGIVSASYSNLLKTNYTGTIEKWCEIEFAGYYANPVQYSKNLYINDTLVTEVNLKNVPKISSYAFMKCSSLKKVVIPNSVTSIGRMAFYVCDNLTTVQLGENVENIAYSAFSHCTNLTDINIPDSVKSIEENAFSNCSKLTTLKIPCSAKFENSFVNCTNINKITITKGTSIMQDYASNQNNTNLTYYQYSPWYISNCSDIVIENGVKNIGSYAFYKCDNLKNISIPDSVTTIGNCAFTEYGNYKYTITYNTNGGYNTPNSQIKILGEDINITDIIPTKDEYIFQGWSTTPMGSVEYQPCDKFSKNRDITLYAIWAKEYIITYNDNDTVLFVQNKSHDKKTVLNYVPSKTYKKLIGWATEKNGNIRYKPSDEYTENKDITLYAVWIDRCSDCDGTGKQKQKDCPQCKGKGYKDVIVDCSNCNGTGETIKKVEYVTCGICHGAKVSWSSSLQSYIPCPFCSATGQVKHEIKGQCSICYGKGTVIKSVKCSSCNGTGKFFSDDTCYTCHGTGVTECMYETSTVKPTCDKMGYTLHKCKHCKKSYKDNYTKVLGHKYDKGKITKQATCTANGVKVYTCSQCKTTKTETIKALGHKYTTKVVKPTYTSGGYTLHTCTRCKKSYKDKKTKKLVLKNTSISKITAGKKAFTIKWKKQSAATGYQIQYSTSSKFKGAKTVTVSKNKTTSKKISKLKARKKYYVRIRTYKTVKVNGKNTKVYSSWSKVKMVKTK